MPAEEDLEVGLAAIEPAADEEGQAAGERQEDHDEDVGERRGEVGRQLALARWSEPHASRPPQAAAWVS